MKESLPLEKFKCLRCNECCRQPGYVYLNEGEADSIARELAMSAFDFINEYCELLDRRRLVLKKKNGEDCIFLKESGCRVYEARPEQCRDFPKKWITEKSFSYCEGLKALAKEKDINEK